MNTPNQNDHAWTPIQDARKGAYIGLFVSRVVAAPVEVVIRTRFGSQYFGLPALLGLFMMPAWVLFWPDADVRGLMWFWAVHVLMQFRARLEVFRMLRRHEIVHTRYNGRPRLLRILRWMDERQIKAIGEPVFVFLCGVFMMPLSQPLGSYLMVAAFCLGLNHSVIESVEQARALQLNDARIEQESIAERFREIQSRMNNRR
jgi:hypothetical protein